MMEAPLNRLKRSKKITCTTRARCSSCGMRLTWAIAHPKRVLEGGFSPLDSAKCCRGNARGEHVHNFHEETGARVVTFIHG